MDDCRALHMHKGRTSDDGGNESWLFKGQPDHQVLWIAQDLLYSHLFICIARCKKYCQVSTIIIPTMY